MLDKVDMQAATARVAALVQEQPGATTAELVQLLIRQRCKQAAAIGAATAGAAIVPGLGTITAATLGMAADVGLMLKLQAELVLEIAAVHGRQLSAEERSRTLLLLTGINVGADKILVNVGRQVAARAGRLAVPRAALKALPVAGVVASAGVNLVLTYSVGQRAHAYFDLGPDAAEDWTIGLRTMTGADELADWLADSLQPRVSGLMQKARASARAAMAAGRARLPIQRDVTAGESSA